MLGPLEGRGNGKHKGGVKDKQKNLGDQLRLYVVGNIVLTLDPLDSKSIKGKSERKHNFPVNT